MFVSIFAVNVHVLIDIKDTIWKVSTLNLCYKLPVKYYIKDNYNSC